MSGLSATTKGVTGFKAAKAAAKRPQILGAAAKTGTKIAGPLSGLGTAIAKPLLKRKARRRARRLGEAASALTSTIVTYAPDAARQLELMLEGPQPRKRTAPRIAVGILIGASGTYFLEPGRGAQRRQKVLELVR